MKHMKKQLLLLAALLLAVVGLWAQNCDDPCSGTMTIHHPPGYTFPSGVYPSTSDQSLTMTFKVVRHNLTGTDQCWMAQNLGSTAQATSVTDLNTAAAGWYWQFNRKQAYKITASSRTPGTSWVSSYSVSSNWTSANDPCTLLLGDGWRLPTSTEWLNAPDFVSLKLHRAGQLYDSNGSLQNNGNYGYYWTSTQNNSGTADGFRFSGSSVSGVVYSKSYGNSVRCLKDL